jgi:hypothetical protein
MNSDVGSGSKCSGFIQWWVDGRSVRKREDTCLSSSWNGGGTDDDKDGKKGG